MLNLLIAKDYPSNITTRAMDVDLGFEVLWNSEILNLEGLGIEELRGWGLEGIRD